MTARNGGRPCAGPTTVLAECPSSGPAHTPLSTDCAFGEWGEWSACSATCGGGQAIRSRAVAAFATGQGLPCQGVLEASRPCNTMDCLRKAKVDCKWDAWSVWSACSATCADGVRQRVREVSASPENDGALCEAHAGTELEACNNGQCIGVSLVIAV